MAFGSKNSTPSFVLTLPFDISLNEQDYLYKEFKKCGVIYNQLVRATTKMWHQLRKTRKYRELMTCWCKFISYKKANSECSFQAFSWLCIRCMFRNPCESAFS